VRRRRGGHGAGRTVNGQPDVVVGTPGFGRSAYLGPDYMNSGYGLGLGNADQLLEQRWPGRARPTAPTITCFPPSKGTSGDRHHDARRRRRGTGQHLGPAVDLYGPGRTLVASDDNSAGDGRNAQLTYTVPTGAGGIYRAVVRGVGDTGGDYTLQISGATGQPVAFTASAVTPADGALLAISQQLHHPPVESVLLDSVDASDPVIDGVAARGVTIVDPHERLVFDITNTSHGDALYTATIAAGAPDGPLGRAAGRLHGAFDSDVTSPWVVSSSLHENDSVPPGAVVYQSRVQRSNGRTSGCGDATVDDNVSGPNDFSGFR